MLAIAYKIFIIFFLYIHNTLKRHLIPYIRYNCISHLLIHNVQYSRYDLPNPIYYSTVSINPKTNIIQICYTNGRINGYIYISYNYILNIYISYIYLIIEHTYIHNYK